MISEAIWFLVFLVVLFVVLYIVYIVLNMLPLPVQAKQIALAIIGLIGFLIIVQHAIPLLSHCC